MKYFHLLAAVAVAFGFGASRCEAASVEQPLGISFVGRYQSTNATNGKLVAKTTLITSSVIVKQILADLGNPPALAGGKLKLSTDADTLNQSVIIRKGNSFTNVTIPFFAQAPTTNLFSLTNIILNQRLYSAKPPALFHNTIVSGVETVTVVASNLTFTLNGYATGPRTQTIGSKTTPTKVTQLSVPSSQPGPTASGSFTFNISTNASAPNLVSGPASSGIITIGAPDRIN